MYNVYLIRDNAAGTFSLPIFARSDEEMCRQLLFDMKKGKSLMSEFPADFDLYHVGVYDDNTANITKIDNRLVVHLAALLRGDKDAGKAQPVLD